MLIHTLIEMDCNGNTLREVADYADWSKAVAVSGFMAHTHPDRNYEVCTDEISGDHESCSECDRLPCTCDDGYRCGCGMPMDTRDGECRDCYLGNS